MATALGAPRPRRYKLTRPAASRHYDFKSDDGTFTFVVDISKFTPGKPNLTLHSGSDTKSDKSVVACVHFPHIGRSFKLGIGNDPNSMAWEDVHREGLGGGTFTWTMDLPGGDGQRVPIVWKKTSHVAVEGMSASRMSNRDWKLVDPQAGILAVFTHQMGFSSCGTLQINVDFGPTFDHAVLMTLVTLYEYSRRRRNATAASAGGAS